MSAISVKVMKIKFGLTWVNSPNAKDAKSSEQTPTMCLVVAVSMTIFLRSRMMKMERRSASNVTSLIIKQQLRRPYNSQQKFEKASENDVLDEVINANSEVSEL